MKLFVFDIDDTLTKSEHQHTLSYITTMKEMGITDINENWKDYLHHTDSYILKENYESNLNSKFDFSFIPKFEERMTELILGLDKVTEINGAKNIIDFFSAHKDYAIAFATGSLLKPAYVKLSQAGISHDPALVAASNQIYSREGIVQSAIDKAKKHYQVDSFDHVISVGDGIWDLNTARNLGVHFIGIGDKNYADFEAAGINVHIKDWVGFDLNLIENKLGIIN